MYRAEQACIDPNPDIAGIGIRVSVYAQSFLCLIQLFLSVTDAKITDNERRQLNKIYASLLLTAFALLISAFIQICSIGLSVYHALIILNLSWINDFGALVWSLVDCTYQPVDEGQEYDPVHAIPQTRSFGRRIITYVGSHKLPTTLLVIHVSTMASLGIWVWSKVAVFGNKPECTPDTVTSVFGYSIPLTNRRLRAVSIAIYSMVAIPGINLFILLLLFFCSLVVVVPLLRIVRWLCGKFIHIDIVYFDVQLAAGSAVLLNTIWVIDTELTISRNAIRVGSGESQWTFGQTLAMLMMTLPFVETLRQAQEWWRN